MTDFDAKLTLLHKKFHSLELGIISDILTSLEGNVDQAGELLASMIPTEAPPVETRRDESDEGKFSKKKLFCIVKLRYFLAINYLYTFSFSLS